MPNQYAAQRSQRSTLHNEYIFIKWQLHQLSEQAKEHPERVFTTLHHLIDVEFLVEAFGRRRRNAAAGIDRMTAKEYEVGSGRCFELPILSHVKTDPF